MKIVQETATQLKLRVRPIQSWIALGTMAVIVLPAYFPYAISGRVMTFTCHRVERTQGSCELAESGLLESGVQKIQLSDLQAAKVESVSEAEHAVMLITKAGKVMLSRYSDDYAQKQALAEQVNQYLKNPQQTSLQIQEDDRWSTLTTVWSWLFEDDPALGTFLLVYFLLAQILSPSVSCTFDKTLGTVTIRQRRLFLTHVIQRSLIDISAVHVQVFKGGRSRSDFCRIDLILKSGKSISLTPLFSVEWTPGGYQIIASHIRKFLDLKAENSDRSSQVKF